MKINNIHQTNNSLKIFLIFIVLITVFLLSYPVKAETGSITVSNESSFSANAKNLAGATFTGHGQENFTQFWFDTGNYSTVINYTITDIDNVLTYAHQSEVTSFTCVNNCTGGGTVSYSSSLRHINWVWSSNTRITGKLVKVSYAHDIFKNISLIAVADINNYIGFEGSDVNYIGQLNATQPMYVANTSGSFCYPSQTAACLLSNFRKGGVNHPYALSGIVGSGTVTNFYTVTYPNAGWYVINISKSGQTVNTKNSIHSQSNNSLSYESENTFNTNDVSFMAQQTDGIYLNVTMQTGDYNDVLINSSGTSGITGISGTILTNKSSYNLSSYAYINYTLNNTNGRIRIQSPTGDTWLYDVSNSSVNTTLQWYIDSTNNIGEYFIYLDYYESGWQNIDYTSFNVLPVSGLSEIRFQFDNYLLSNIAEIDYYANGSNYYIDMIDSNNNLKYTHNITSSETNISSFFTYAFKQSDSLGTWTVKLYNNSGVLFSSDTTIINYNIVNSSPVVTSTSIDDTSLIAIPALMGKLTIGEFDVDSDNTLVDSPHNKNIGMNILYTLILLVGLIFIFGSYRKIKK